LNKLLLLLVTNYFDRTLAHDAGNVGGKIALDNPGFKTQPNTSTSIHNEDHLLLCDSSHPKGVDYADFEQNPHPNPLEQSSKLSQCPNPECHFIEGFSQSFTSCSQCHYSFCSQCHVYDCYQGEKRGLDAELHEIFPNCQIFKLIRNSQTNLAKNSKR
jgi:hypothetical protein